MTVKRLKADQNIETCKEIPVVTALVLCVSVNGCVKFHISGQAERTPPAQSLKWDTAEMDALCYTERNE